MRMSSILIQILYIFTINSSNKKYLINLMVFFINNLYIYSQYHLMFTVNMEYPKNLYYSYYTTINSSILPSIFLIKSY